MEAIETRLARIENQLRFQRRIIGFLILLLMAGISYGAVKGSPAVVQAQRFEAIDKKGRVRAVMASFPGHGDGVFRAYNRAGVEVFYAGSSGPGDGRVEVKTRRGKLTTVISGKRR